MNVFLTGGTGFIGQPLTKSLLERGWSVTALVRKADSPQAQALKTMGVELATGDITTCESMRAAMSGADIVVHNAGQYEFGMDSTGAQHMRAVNVEGTRNVLALAYELGIPRTVYVSTVQAYGDTGGQQRDEGYTRQAPCQTTYEKTKTEAHEIALQFRERGLPLVIVCPHQVIGVNDHSAFGWLVRLYVNRVLPPMCWSPNTVFCCVDVRDVAEGIVLACEKGRIGETYLLCGERQTFREVMSYWSTKAGAFHTRLWLPSGLMAAVCAPLEPLERMAGLPAFLSRETVRAGSLMWDYCSEKAQRELGWRFRSAEAMWSGAIDGEIELLSRRKGQSLIKRLKPLDVVELRPQ